MPQPPASPSPGAFWDQRYAEPGFAFGEKPNEWLAANRDLFQPGMRALVPGDGEGRNGVFLAELGLDVTTVDASSVGVRKAQALAAKRGVKIDAQAADLLAWQWPKASFDVVASIYLHWPSRIRPQMHELMMAALKPGGIIVLEAYTPRQLSHRATGSVGGPADIDMLFEPSALRQDFAGMEIRHLEEVDVVLGEGNRHTGRSSVVRLLARLP